MKIVPSILSEDFGEFLKKLRQAETFTDYIQIDLMDGFFVPSKSFPAEQINGIKTTLSFEIHLMADNPLAFIDRIDNKGLKKVIFHFESPAAHQKVIDRLRERGLSAGMAIKPETAIQAFRDEVESVDSLLFLTVRPGSYGNPFKPEVLRKIKDTRRLFPGKVIAVDGGVSPDNLKNLADIGVDYACVGSRIFLNGDPKENYGLFINTIEELEADK